jgi:hypothetical protein
MNPDVIPPSSPHQADRFNGNPLDRGRRTSGTVYQTIIPFVSYISAITLCRSVHPEFWELWVARERHLQENTRLYRLDRLFWAVKYVKQNQRSCLCNEMAAVSLILKPRIEELSWQMCRSGYLFKPTRQYLSKGNNWRQFLIVSDFWCNSGTRQLEASPSLRWSNAGEKPGLNLGRVLD